MSRVSMVVIAFVAACSGTNEGPPEVPVRDLKVVSVTPTSVGIGGTDRLTITTENGCGPDRMTITVGDLPAADLRASGLDTYTFSAPARPALAGACAPSAVVVVLTCSAPPSDASFKYGVATAQASISYDPRPGGAVGLVAWTPRGSTVAREASVIVQFGGSVDPASVTTTSFGLEGVTGTITADPDGRTFKFTPSELLAPATAYRAFVKTGTGGVTDTGQRPVCPAIALDDGSYDPSGDHWGFTTHAAALERLETADVSPIGETVDPLAPCVVRFSSAPVAVSIDTSTVFSPGVPGVTTWDAATLTATFTPSGPRPAGPGECRVRGGAGADGGAAVFALEPPGYLHATRPAERGPRDVDDWWTFTVVARD